MPLLNEDGILMDAYVGETEASHMIMGGDVVWEHYTRVAPFTATTSGTKIPDWALSVGVAIIGGGGGGQTGNGTHGSSGRPGAAAQWIAHHYTLGRRAGDRFHTDITVGDGGAGGTNSDHSAGKLGGETKVTIWRRNADGVFTQMATYTATGGKGGPDSGLSIGGTSTRPNITTAPRQALQPPFTLPRGTAAEKGQVGGSPGAGGGCGDGGVFGSRTVGRAGGKGRAILYYYGIP